MPRLFFDATPAYRKNRSSELAIVTVAGRDRCLGPHGAAAGRKLCDHLVDY